MQGFLGPGDRSLHTVSLSEAEAVAKVFQMYWPQDAFMLSISGNNSYAENPLGNSEGNAVNSHGVLETQPG